MDILARLQAEDFGRKQAWINEALFGLRHVAPYLDRPDPLRVLEVGSGSGILLALLADRFPQHRMEGLEPFGSGFDELRDIAAFVTAQGVPVHAAGYEDFTPAQPCDLVFLVNVFEHLPDWRDFLRRVEGWLAPGGICLVLCPNYGFPYESHFRLPVIGTKRLTQRVFAARIARYERDEDLVGLWASLNFVRLAEVKRFVRTRQALSLTVRPGVLTDMVDRLEADETFRDRQRVMGRVALAVRRLGLLKLLDSPLLENLQPYMMLEVRRTADPGAGTGKAALSRPDPAPDSR